MISWLVQFNNTTGLQWHDRSVFDPLLWSIVIFPVISFSVTLVIGLPSGNTSLSHSWITRSCSGDIVFISFFWILSGPGTLPIFLPFSIGTCIKDQSRPSSGCVWSPRSSSTEGRSSPNISLVLSQCAWWCWIVEGPYPRDHYRLPLGVVLVRTTCLCGEVWGFIPLFQDRVSVCLFPWTIFIGELSGDDVCGKTCRTLL